MSDQPEDLILMYLRRIDERTARMEDNIRDISRRLEALASSIDRLTSDSGRADGARGRAGTLH